MSHFYNETQKLPELYGATGIIHMWIMMGQHQNNIKYTWNIFITHQMRKHKKTQADFIVNLSYSFYKDCFVL